MRLQTDPDSIAADETQKTASKDSRDKIIEVGSLLVVLPSIVFDIERRRSRRHSYLTQCGSRISLGVMSTKVRIHYSHSRQLVGFTTEHLKSANVWLLPSQHQTVFSCLAMPVRISLDLIDVYSPHHCTGRTHSPLAGQGANGAMTDACNLGTQAHSSEQD